MKFNPLTNGFPFIPYFYSLHYSLSFSFFWKFYYLKYSTITRRWLKEKLTRNCNHSRSEWLTGWLAARFNINIALNGGHHLWMSFLVFISYFIFFAWHLNAVRERGIKKHRIRNWKTWLPLFCLISKYQPREYLGHNYDGWRW